MRLVGKAAVVTGGGKGIGKATCLAMSREGARVCVADVDLRAAAEVADAIQAEGGTAVAVQVDVSRSEQVALMIDRAMEALGRLDILVNSAGIAYNGDAVETDEENWDRLIGVNLKGTWLCCKYAIPKMLASAGGGAIVNLGSIASFVGLSKNAAYNASKGGVLLLTKNMAVDFAPRIRVNALCPAMILTPMLEAYMDTVPDRPEYIRGVEDSTPLARMGTAEEVARAAVFLASDESSYLTGSALMADGGYTAR